MHLPVFYVVAIGLSLLLSLNLVLIILFWRYSTLTHLLALDTLSLLLIALLALYAHAQRAVYYLDVALILALLAFVGTLAMAQYHSTGQLFGVSSLAPGMLSTGTVGPWEEGQALINTLLPWVADGLILLGLGIMSIAIYGMFWLPDVFMRLHAASKIGVLGIIPILLATLTTGEPALICRSLLIIVFLLSTIPVSSHAIARAAMQSGDSTDWSA